MLVRLITSLLILVHIYAIEASLLANYKDINHGSVLCERNRSTWKGQTPLGMDAMSKSCCGAMPEEFPFNRIDLQAPDDSIRATMIPFGARMVNFWTRDRTDMWRDVHLGLDHTTDYAVLVKLFHPFMGSTIGRYAGRIKNGTFSIDGKVYHTPLNENGTTTLSGGPMGYDQGAWTVEKQTSSHVSFVLHDKDGNQGFPGAVIARARYTLHEKGELHMRMDANVTSPDKKTPLMMWQNGIWALHGYKDDSDTILHHTLHLPLVDKAFDMDSIRVPTGRISRVEGTPLDFRKPRAFSQRYDQSAGLCGIGCQGWDNTVLMSKPHPRKDDVLSLTSPETGIRMRVSTDQTAMNLYTCNFIRPGSGPGIPRKMSHGGDASQDKTYEPHTCFGLSLTDYPSAITYPQWGRHQIHDRSRPYHWAAEYKFDAVK